MTQLQKISEILATLTMVSMYWVQWLEMANHNTVVTFFVPIVLIYLV